MKVLFFSLFVFLIVFADNQITAQILERPTEILNGATQLATILTLPDTSQKQTVGGFVVMNVKNPTISNPLNNAPDLEITIGENLNFLNNVVLSIVTGADKINIYTSQTDGTPIVFDGKNNVFQNGQLPQNLWVEGVNPSVTCRDVKISATLQGTNLSDNIVYTVLWGSAPNINSQGSISNNFSRT